MTTDNLGPNLDEVPFPLTVATFGHLATRAAARSGVICAFNPRMKWISRLAPSLRCRVVSRNARLDNGRNAQECARRGVRAVRSKAARRLSR